ncbi:response regulator [Candidatus Azambacteria bacterium]|nr:response regulator [Candidatus Azambacteria bacterium]
MPKKSILVVEDEKPIAKALQITLSGEGYDVDIASDGIEALDAMDKKMYDLILLDILMPKMDGFTVLDNMRKRDIKTSVIMLSNLSQDEDMKKAKDFGSKGYLVKSDMSIEDIVSEAKKIIDGSVGA